MRVYKSTWSDLSLRHFVLSPLLFYFLNLMKEFICNFYILYFQILINKNESECFLNI